MWIKVSGIILRNKLILLTSVLVLTLFLGYHARNVQMSYEYASMLPQKDQAYKDYQKFTGIFGEEGNLIMIGIQDPDFFTMEHFNRWSQFTEELDKVEGVEDLLSVNKAYDLKRNQEERKYQIKPVFPAEIESQEQLDTLAERFFSLPFYRDVLYNSDENTYLLVITVNKDKMHSRDRERMIQSIQRISENFEETNDVKLHYSGLPYIRVVNSLQIKKEIYLFSALALAICIVVLFIFFRSFKAVFYPVLIVLTGVVWSMGLLSLFGFKITILSGMIPPLLIVIGIPNSIYMLNKFHHEFVRHGNRVKALQRVIIKIGNATFLTNLTTAAGFATFIITKSEILVEFGIVSSLSIMSLFLLSLILIPIIFSFVQPPTSRHVRHLEYRWVIRIIDYLIIITRRYRKQVYITTILVIVIGLSGITLLKSSGYMVDDIPESDPIYKDLRFFEENFHGLMPLEILIDTKKPNGVLQLSTFTKIDLLEQKLAEYSELSPSLSLLNLLKFAKQAFYNGDPGYYSIPNNYERNFILSYAMQEDNNSGLLHSFLDSAKQLTRVSIRVKDVGTKRMEQLYADFRTNVDSIFDQAEYDIIITGSSVTAFKGTQYLQKNLIMSLGLAIFLISLFMALMFSSWRMVVMSLVPNVIPLIFTAATMGFTGIPIKASTILVFSIAFGISVDNTIHFLAKYRQELKVTGWNISRSVVLALRETGVSMLYTSVVLFFGFGIFSLSGFGGTVALGVLVSLTLLVALTSNLILLPSLLTGLDKLTTTDNFRKPLIEIYDDEEVNGMEELNNQIT
jgi:predicted RND superfamily exporter protein